MRLASATLLAALTFGLLLSGTPDVVRAQAPIDGTALVLGTGGTGVKVRSGPGLSHGILGVVPEGARVDILDGPKLGEDQLWYQLNWTNGAEAKLRGWAAAMYLVKADRIAVRDDGALGSRTFAAKVSGYVSGGAIGFYTATGTRVRWGTVAVDPAFIPLGSLLLIDGLEGVFSAEDTGGAVKGAVLDVWFPDRPAALAWGTRQRPVTVLREGM